MNEEKEEKGFVFKDRRKISLEDSEPRAETGVEEAMSPKPEQEISGKSGKPSQQEEGPRPSGGPMPEVSFSTFVFSLSSSALVHLGEIPEPSTQQMHQDLMLAKQIIDTDPLCLNNCIESLTAKPAWNFDSHQVCRPLLPARTRPSQ